MILTSSITTVTVFTDRASVTRTGQAELEAGEHTLIFDDLPGIDENSIQVNGAGKATLGNVKFQTAYEDVPEVDKQAVLDEKQKLEDQRQDMEDAISRLGKEKNFLENISTKITTPTEESDKTELDSDKWLKIMTFYSQKLEGIDKEIRKIERSKRDINDQITKLNWQLQQSGVKNRKIKNQVAVTLTVSAPGSVVLDLTYIAFGVSWVPVYDLRVVTENKQMRISYNARINQTTGEDWLDSELKLSTARPQIAGYQPELSPWRVNIYSPYPPPVMSMPRAKKMDLSTKETSVAYGGGGYNDEQEEVAFAGIPAIEAINAVAETGSTAVVFSIAGKHTIKADNSDHQVSILIEDFSAYFQYSTVPKLSQFAYLKAKVTNETDFPFLAGEANVFLDNHFVATTRLQTIAPTEEFWTYLGVDESFKIEHKFLKKYEKKETQLFTKNRKVLVYEYQIKIKSHKKTQEEIVVWDQLPISGNEQIKVQLLEPTYKENTDALKKNELEYLEWFYKIKAGEEILIPFKFTVEYPQDVQVTGLQ
ncbi:mucoidy inhibitor MuiA family protein [Cytophagaceae bacterium DM2B3-1]|uniref:Mucoidy inhibitor MuiA family protein n=1 Tax=Xanthocytophaga flava TaxID=3048013 RepID=A0ABT7CE93_9BACT|nr:mucoidy inhibitor MuiA family protein [Xanthocytophaga flavus]MDJ1468888.1 mucoidy inhibitor MuiA family protein [Xanthocytophaga flavus]MDJ1492062.1 mucoidy inhibitor MuiA family protein [Xanthocytophaga flavus]